MGAYTTLATVQMMVRCSSTFTRTIFPVKKKTVLMDLFVSTENLSTLRKTKMSWFLAYALWLLFMICLMCSPCFVREFCASHRRVF